MNKHDYNEEVVSYYKRSGWLYKYFWYSSRSLALHYGFWNKETKSHDESLLNQYLSVIDSAHISKGMKVLDAGCGVGGGSIYITKNTEAEVVGISISQEQVLQARENANKIGLDRVVQFLVEDYTQTTFPNNYFDVVYAIESVCYAYPKRDFLKESYRLLKPGGVLVISDGYCQRKPRNMEEKLLISKFCSGWRLKELIIFDEMSLMIKKVNFRQIVVEDKTSAVKHSLDRMAWLIWLAKPIVFISNYLPFSWLTMVRDNTQSMEASRLGVELGLLGYYIHVAVKPKK